MNKYYAVARGRQIGIFTDWETTKSHVNGFPSAKYKSFKSVQEAKEYLRENNISLENITENNIPLDNIITKRDDIHEDLNIKNNIISIYTDGSYTQGRGGIGIVYVYNNEIINEFFSKMDEYPTTNNRAELLAIYTVLFNITNFEYEYKIYSDSEYSVKTYNEYIHNWLKNDFKGIKNLDIIKPTWELFQSISKKTKLSIEWVESHSDNKYNNRADILAKKGRDS